MFRPVGFQPLDVDRAAGGGRLVDDRLVVARGEHVVEEAIEGALGRHARVELAERPGGGVAGIGEGVLALLDPLAIVRVKRGPRDIDLPAHRQVVGVVPAESLGDRADRPDVLGDVLARLAVAAGRRPLVDAVDIDHFQGEPVELRFADVLDIACDVPNDPIGERLDIRSLAAGIDREEGDDVVDSPEFVQRSPADSLGR